MTDELLLTEIRKALENSGVEGSPYIESAIEIAEPIIRKDEREKICQWLRDIGADEYMVAKLNNELIAKAIEKGQALRGEK